MATIHLISAQSVHQAPSRAVNVNAYAAGTLGIEIIHDNEQKMTAVTKVELTLAETLGLISKLSQYAAQLVPQRVTLAQVAAEQAEARRRDVLSAPDTPATRATAYAELLKSRFPWLGTDDCPSGSDVIDALADLYDSLERTSDAQSRRSGSATLGHVENGKSSRRGRAQ